jgi:hypothetical protein
MLPPLFSRPQVTKVPTSLDCGVKVPGLDE